MSGHSGRPEAQLRRRDRRIVRPLHSAYPNTSDPTTDRSSSPSPCRTGSEPSGPRRPTLSGAVPGRTASSRASTPGFATNCLMERSSLACRGQDRHRELAAPLQHERPHGSLGYKPPGLKCSSPPSPRGRLPNPRQLRRFCSEPERSVARRLLVPAKECDAPKPLLARQTSLGNCLASAIARSAWRRRAPRQATL
jgi:hypothetical protein